MSVALLVYEQIPKTNEDNTSGKLIVGAIDNRESHYTVFRRVILPQLSLEK